MSLADARDTLGPDCHFFLSPLSTAAREQTPFSEGLFPFYIRGLLLKILF